MAAGAMNRYQSSPQGWGCEETETDLAWASFRPFPFLSYGARRAHRQSRPRHQ